MIRGFSRRCQCPLNSWGLLRQVIIGAHFESDDTVDLVPLSGRHDDRNVRLGAKPSAQRQSVLSRKHQIEQDEVDAAVREHLVHGTTASGRTDAKTFLGKRARNKLANFAMIVDDKNARRALHDANRTQAMRFRELVTKLGRRGR
jgi:hypothetical protein